VAQWLRQPRVIGEVVVGLLLGPSVFGAVAPDLRGYLFPDAALPLVGAVANLALVSFMFLIGIDLRRPMRDGAAANPVGRVVALTALNFLLPFGIGVAATELIAAPRRGLIGSPSTCSSASPSPCRQCRSWRGSWRRGTF